MKTQVKTKTSAILAHRFKKHLPLALVTRSIPLSIVLGLTLSCGSLEDPSQFIGSNDENKNSQINQKKDTRDDDESSDLYLDDVADSAAETKTTTTSTDGVKDAEGEKTVRDDLTAERVEKMSKKIIEKLDTNKDASLSLEEFLFIPKARADQTQCGAEKAKIMIEKMTADFNNYSGEDKLLSLDEVKKLLVEVGPRVGKFRSKMGPGDKHGKDHGKNHKGGRERVKASFEEVIAQFDTNKDGLLDQKEFAEWQKTFRGYGP